jgi:hypothetical protein
LSQYAKDIIDISDRLFRYAEPAATLVTGAAAEPLSGLYGLANLAITRNPDAAANAVNQAQRALTYQPRTAQGQAGLRGLQDILQPIGEVVQGASQNLGDKAYGATGSPALAAAAYSAPTAMLEALGLKGLSIAKSPVKAADLYSARMGMGDIPAEYADNFNQWFGDSKMIDAEGKPQVFYHGTNAGDIEEFNPYASSGMTDSSGAIFFSSDPTNASGYALRGKAKKDGGKAVHPAYLNIRNPLVLDFSKDPYANWSQFEIKSPDFDYDPMTRQLRPLTPEEASAITTPLMTRELAEGIVQFRDKIPKTSASFSDNVDRIMQRGTVMDINDLTKIAKAMGKDAMIAKGIFDAGKKTHMVKQDSIAVFSPEQIKSAVGNSGNFSKSSKSTSN